MRSYLIPVLIAFLLLIGCSGEGYVSVKNDTPSPILVSVNNDVHEVVGAGDTSDVHTVSLIKGVVNNVPVDATGEWIGIYSETAAVTDGENVVHRITPQVADITLTNLSVDSAACLIENYDVHLFAGSDSITGKFTVDANVDVEYAGRYMFFHEETMNWMPGSTYRYELVPDACEIQLNNLHPTYTIYYVFISMSTSDSWGDDQLGDDVIESNMGYVWKAEGDTTWDIRVEAADPHPDSTTMHIYEFYDTEPCTSDITWIYMFPNIFTPVVESSASSKINGPENGVLKPYVFGKTTQPSLIPDRIEKIRKVDAGKADIKALRK